METLSERLEAAQADALRIRCESFVDYSPTVAGETLRPITLQTYNRLLAFGNAFVTGEAAGFEDVANFVWVHSPHFGQFNRRAKRETTRRVYSALRPAFPTLNGALATLSKFPRLGLLGAFVVPSESDRLSAAAEEIRRLLKEATCELPVGDGEGEPLPFAFSAYVMNLFRRHLDIPFDETEQMPLRRLAQHLREVLRHISGGKALLLTRSEVEIWREHLGRDGHATPGA